MPRMSSGPVSISARIAGRPAAAAASAAPGENTSGPETAPGEAGRPWPIRSRVASGAIEGWRWSSRKAGSTRSSASSRLIAPRSASSTAMRTAARAERRAGRASRIWVAPALTVNSRLKLSPKATSSRSAASARRVTAAAHCSSSEGSLSPLASRSAMVSTVGVRSPISASSPWAEARYLPVSTFSPLVSSRGWAIPAPLGAAPRPSTIACTISDSPAPSPIPRAVRRSSARGLSQATASAAIAPCSWSPACCGKAPPASSIRARQAPASSSSSAVESPVSLSTPAYFIAS